MRKVILTGVCSSMIAIALFGCNKEQYRGYHLQVSKQAQLKDEHNNYHVKETNRVLIENEQRKEKREKEAQKKRRAAVKYQLRHVSKYQRTKPLVFDFY